MSEPTDRRAYKSDLRAEQAQATRHRVLAAAAAAFAASGFQATTLATIARAARVSTETVKNVGSKAELLVGGFELVFAGAEGADSLTDTPAAGDVFALSDDRFIVAVVAAIAAANARGHRLWTVVVGAALSDPLVDAALTRILDNRARDYTGLVAEVSRRGLAAKDLDAASVAAELSFLMSPEGYQQLVAQAGWSEDRYRAWLAAGVERVVGARS